jgi:NTE family protein
VVIQIDTGGLGSTDFKKGAQLMAAGSAAAVAKEADLRRLADQLGPPAPRVASRPPPQIDYVRVENSSKLSDRVLLRYVEPFVGRPMDGDAISEALRRARALGGFSRLDYRIEERDGRTGLVIQVDQQPGDTRRLRPGLTIAAAGQGHSEFDVSLEYRLLQLDANGSEARFAVTLGDRKEFTAEYFKVLDGWQRWFIEPSIQFYKRPIAVYDSKGFRLGDYDATYGLGVLGIGRQFGTVGEFRVGLQAGGGKASLQEGSVTPRDVDIHTGQVFASGGIDTLDNPFFPTRGYRLTPQYTAGLTALGEAKDFQSASASGIDAISFGPNTLVLNAEGRSRLQGVLPLPSLYTLGGPFSFPGYSIEELTGQTYFAGRLMYRRKVVDRSDRLFGLPVYLGATVVTGNTWAKPSAVNFSNLRVGGNVFVATDTIIGPVFLSVGAAERDRYAFYVFLGKPF